MPPRLSKRQQRQLEELGASDAKGTAGNQDTGSRDEADDEVLTLTSGTSTAGFGALLMNDDIPDEVDDDEEQEAIRPSSKKSKSKKKKSKAAIPVSSDPPSAPPTPDIVHNQPSKGERKALKKAKAKEKKQDDLDVALAELSLKYPNLQSTSSKAAHIADQTAPVSSPANQHFFSLLAVSVPHLDPEAEMRKFFGSKVVQANKASSSTAAPKRGTAAASNALRKSQLTKPQPAWWNAAKQREGLDLRALSEEERLARTLRQITALGLDNDEPEATEVEGEKWWTVEASKKYKYVTAQFMGTVMSGDPQGFWNVLAKLPWHADTLLQLSEVYRHREEHAQAVDFVNRALFSYERAFLGVSEFSFTSGTNRLDFDRVENRPFFLGVHRQVVDLQRKGCVRTAFEFARLLYSLDPWTDPHGSLLHLDYLAVKSGMGDWLRDAWKWFEQRRESAKDPANYQTTVDPSVLPGWAYSRALAAWIDEGGEKSNDHTSSTDLLTTAILTFPSILPLLADKIDISLPSSIRTHPRLQIQIDTLELNDTQASLHLLSHLFVHRTTGVWKEKPRAAWLLATASSLSSTSFDADKRRERGRENDFLAMASSTQFQLSLLRHLTAAMDQTTYRRLVALIPKRVIELAVNGGDGGVMPGGNVARRRGGERNLACDPVPPLTAVSLYDEAYFAGIINAGEDGGEGVGGLRRGPGAARRRRDEERLLERVVGNAEVRRHLQGFFDANPEFAARFPGGVVQFAEMAMQLPGEAVEDMMAEQVMAMGDGVPGGGGLGDDGVRLVPVGLGDDDAMPGAFDGGEIEGEDEGDEDDEEDGSVVPRVLRNLFGRFWGGRGEVPGSESSDEDEAGG